MGTGSDFVKKIRPLGCAAFLLLMVLVIVICFTTRGIAVEGYEAPHDSDYYSEHLDELAEEIRTNLLPLTESSAIVEYDGDTVRITAETDDLNTIRSQIVHYYKVGLFDFVYAD